MVENNTKDPAFNNYEYGKGFSDYELQDKVNVLLKHDTELTQIRNFLLKKKLEKLDQEGSGAIFRAAIPSFILLIISFFVDVSTVPLLGEVAQNFAEYFFPGTVINKTLQPIQFWWLPIVAYIIFISCAVLSSKALRKEVYHKGGSEGSITRIIERYSGIVDAIGTALPLLGAAILLVSIKEGPSIFLGFSVPFEIKSIIILAIAKLFDSIFEVQALRYQDIIEDIKRVETEYNYEQQTNTQSLIIRELEESNQKIFAAFANQKPITKEETEQMYKLMKIMSDVNDIFAKNVVNMKNSVAELSNLQIFGSDINVQLQNVTNTLSTAVNAVQKSTEYSVILKENMESVRRIVSEINNIKLPEEKILKELQITSHFLSETINNMKDSNAIKSLDNLVYLAGKR